jgi:hypothetical protein
MSQIEELCLEANPDEKPKESRMDRESKQSAELAAEMLTWGEWSGADMDFINRANAGEMLGDEAEILREMHEQRQRERRFRQ